MVLPHIEAGQGPIVAVGVDDLDAVHLLVLDAAAILVLLAHVHQRLDQPDQAHLVGRAPFGGGQIAHLAGKSDVLISYSIYHQLQGDVGGLVAVVVQLLDENAIGFQIVPGRQVVRLARGSDFQHGDQFHIAVVVGIAVGGGILIVKGGAVLILNLSL